MNAFLLLFNDMDKLNGYYNIYLKCTKINERKKKSLSSVLTYPRRITKTAFQNSYFVLLHSYYTLSINLLLSDWLEWQT